MAVQMNFEELEDCTGYFDWMIGKITGQNIFGDEVRLGKISARVEPLVGICREMFETDFIVWVPEGGTAIKEDEIRAVDAMEVRRVYAEEVGEKAGKSERDIDRIWKSIHGKCSVLELIFSMCKRLDEMVNEDEPGTMIGMFFGILAGNLGFIFPDPDTEDGKCKAILGRFMKREYNADGSGGGLFPITKWSAESGSKDQRKVCIWYQMNTWLPEHLDEDEHFLE